MNATLSASCSARCSKSLGYTSSFIAVHPFEVDNPVMNFGREEVAPCESIPTGGVLPSHELLGHS